jgi:hypothetical protein
MSWRIVSESLYFPDGFRIRAAPPLGVCPGHLIRAWKRVPAVAVNCIIKTT